MSSWTLVGRTHELASALESLRAGRGVLLSGPPGVGKSRLAAEVAAQLADDGYDVIHAAGSAATATLPLAAVVALLPSTLAMDGTPLAVQARASLQARGRNQPLVVVDDAHLLDDASATLLHQLVLAGDVLAVVTTRHGADAAEQVVRLWRDSLLLRIDLDPLDEESAGACAEAVAGHRLTPAARQRLWELAQGNPLSIREVLVAAHSAGQLRVDDGVADLTGIPVDAPRLADLIRSRLAHLSPAAHEALVHVSFGEPLGPGELHAVASDDVVAELDHSGLLSITEDGRRLVIRLAHPLYGDVLRASTSALTRRRVLRQLGDALAGTGARRREDNIRRAAWSLDSGAPLDAHLLADAARSARFAMDFDLAARLAREAYEREPSWDTAFVLADVLNELADLEALEALLPRLDHFAATPAQVIAAGLMRHGTAYLRRGDAAAPDRLLELADAVVPAPEHAEARGLASHLLAFSGELDRAAALAAPLLGGPSSRAALRAATGAAHAAAGSGRPHDAVAIIDDALRAADQMGPQMLMTSTRVLASVRDHALLEAGGLDEARQRSGANREAFRSLGAHTSAAFAGMSEATAALYSGAVTTARHRFVEAERAFAIERLAGQRRWALGGAALAATWQQDPAGARALLAQHAELGAHPSALHDHLAERAEAWCLAGEHHPQAARSALTVAATRWAQRGLTAAAMFCWYDLARLGDPDPAAAALSDIADQRPTALAAALAAHARGLVSGHHVDLAAAATALADLGALGWATEAAVATAEAAARAGDRRAGAHWHHRAGELAARCEGAAAPAIAPSVAPVPLTRREREIAHLASQGLASKLIGERLFLSTRTVENHLARAYDKLGVRSRAELAQLFEDSVLTS